MQYVGIDWAYRRAAWCAKQADGSIAGEGFVPAHRVYERGGFTPCGAFLDYPDSGHSAFFEKRLR